MHRDRENADHSLSTTVSHRQNCSCTELATIKSMRQQLRNITITVPTPTRAENEPLNNWPKRQVMGKSQIEFSVSSLIFGYRFKYFYQISNQIQSQVAKSQNHFGRNIKPNLRRTSRCFKTVESHDSWFNQDISNLLSLGICGWLRF